MPLNAIKCYGPITGANGTGCAQHYNDALNLRLQDSSYAGQCHATSSWVESAINPQPVVVHSSTTKVSTCTAHTTVSPSTQQQVEGVVPRGTSPWPHPLSTALTHPGAAERLGYTLTRPLSTAHQQARRKPHVLHPDEISITCNQLCQWQRPQSRHNKP